MNLSRSSDFGFRIFAAARKVCAVLLFSFAFWANPDPATAQTQSSPVIELGTPKFIQAHQSSINDISYQPNRSFILTSSGQGIDKLWDASGEETMTLPVTKGFPVFRGVFDPQGVRIATSSYDGKVRLWDVNGKLLSTLDTHKAAATSVAFSPRGDMIAVSSDDGTTRFWQGNKQLDLSFQSQGVSRNVIFHPQKSIVAISSDDGRIRIASIDQKINRTFETSQGTIRKLDFSADGKWLLSGGFDGTIKVWDLSGKLLLTISSPDETWVNNLAFSPDGQTILAVNDSGLLILSLRGQLLKKLALPQARNLSLGVRWDGKQIAVGQSNGTLVLIDVVSGILGPAQK